MVCGASSDMHGGQALVGIDKMRVGVSVVEDGRDNRIVEIGGVYISLQIGTL